METTDNRCILSLRWSSLCDDEADARYLRPFLACIDDITAVTYSWLENVGAVGSTIVTALLCGPIKTGLF